VVRDSCVLFSHPADFTPVCTTELGTVANYYPEFEKKKYKVIALSVDGLESHLKWIDIEETQNVTLQYPLLQTKVRLLQIFMI
jgi:alkyl hydroperoxide reductase subunit AhpC